MRKPPDLPDAVRKFVEFNKFDPRGVQETDLKIPKQMVFLGECYITYYSSDKWDKKIHYYKHEHEAGVKLCVPTGTGETVTVPSWIRETHSLVLLGKSEMFDYEDENGRRQRKISSGDLYSVPSGRALLAIVSRSKIAALLWGGNLTVSAHGIEF